MKTIILYGELAKRYGKYHRFAVKNVAEAVRALRVNFKGFEQYMCNAHLDNVGFKVFVGGSKMRDHTELSNPVGSSEVIRIVPVLVGSGNGWVNVIVGALMIVAGILVAVGTFGTGTGAAVPLIIGGIGMIVGGVTQLLAPQPKTPGTPEAQKESNRASSIFSGPVNVSAQGRAVPVGYGRMIVGSVVISAGIETYEA